MARYHNGWVKIYRKLTSLDSDIGNNGYRLAIFTTLLAWANVEESTVQWNGKPRKIKRGQVVIGVRHLAAHLSFSKDTVFRQIEYLCLRDTIRKETATEGTLITILKYEQYQDVPKEPRQGCDKAATLAGRDSGRQPNASEPPNEEVKKEEVIHDSDFESVYKKYPLKKGKTPGMNICKRKIKTRKDLADLSKAIQNYALQCTREKKTKQYIMHFGTFMGQWKDFLEDGPDQLILAGGPNPDDTTALDERHKRIEAALEQAKH